jgi:hypothetical protein
MGAGGNPMISERIYAREESPEPAPIEGTSPLLELTKREDPKWKSALSYERLGPGRLALAGKLDGRSVRINLRLDAKPDFLLLNRGFHWINEYPFNR